MIKKFFIFRIDKLINLNYLNISNNNLISLEGLSDTNILYLDISMNKLTSLSNLPIKLIELKAVGNKFVNLDGLENCISLNILSLQRNKISDINKLSNSNLSTLTQLYLSENCLESKSLNDIRHTLSLLTNLEELNMLDNPICSDDDYKLILLENPNIKRLDNAPVRPYIRQQVVELMETKQVNKIIENVILEYSNRINIEKNKADQQLHLLKAQQKMIEETVNKYSSDMESEMEQVVRFLHRASKKEKDWFFTPENVKEWQEQLAIMSKERKEQEEKLQAYQKELKMAELSSYSKVVSFTDKLLQISMAKPQLWRAMKEKELELRMQNEKDDEKSKK